MAESASIPRVGRSAPVAEIVSLLGEHGCVVVEHLVAADTLAAMNAEIDPWIERADPEMEHINPVIGAFFGPRTRHVGGVAAKSPTFAAEVMCDPTFLGVCDAILGPSCASYQLNIGHVLQRGPGSDAQLLHRDEDVWVHVPRPHTELQLASMTALGDFTTDLGATRIVPGSHRWPRERWPEAAEIGVAEMPRGSTVLYLGSTLHGAGANVGDRDRRGLHLSYVVGWLRTEENNCLATPPSVAKDLPRKAQELLGYGVHDAIEDAGGYLGVVGLRDPIDLLDEGALE